MNKSVLLILALVFSSAVSSFASEDEIAKWDPRMAAEASIVTNGVKWIDGEALPIEGRWNLGDSKEYYARLPGNLTTAVNGGVRSMRTHTSGMLFRFKTDSDFLVVSLAPSGGWHAMNHMTEVGVSGWDVYRLDAKSGQWRFVSSQHGAAPSKTLNGGKEKRVKWNKGEECIINLPLYNGVKAFRLGIAPEAKIEAPSPWRSGITKPVVFYGTSITHGGCASRPGLGWVNIIGRQLDIPVYGLGFSGSGRMEYELSDVIAKIDASCYVLDCIWNMNYGMVEKNYEPFIRNLRKNRPDTPIIMAEWCNVFFEGQKDNRDDFIKKLYDKLIAEGWKNLYYLPKDEMFTGDFEGTVDGCHPNDLGMMSLAKAFGNVIKEALELK